MNQYSKLTNEEIEGAKLRLALSTGEDTIAFPGDAVIVFDGRNRPLYSATVEGVYAPEGASNLKQFQYEIRKPDGRTRRIGASRVSTTSGTLMKQYEARIKSEEKAIAKEMELFKLAIASSSEKAAVLLVRDT